MANKTVRTDSLAPRGRETGNAVPESGEAPGMGAPPRQQDRDEGVDPAELDDPMAGSPDRKPTSDNPGQRPLTDNKAGG